MKIEVTLRWMNDVVEVRRVDPSDKTFMRFTLGTHDGDNLFVPLTDAHGVALASHTLLSRGPDGRVWLALPTGEVGPVTEQTRAAFTSGPFCVEVTAALPEALVPWLPSFDTLFANTAT